MSEEANVSNVESIDQLNVLDLTNTDTSRPLLKEAVYDIVLHQLELKEQKSKLGKNLNVVLKLAKGGEAKDGTPIQAGFTFIETISLVPTEKYNPTENLARLQECFLGVKGRFIAAELIGQTGQVRLKITSDKEYGDQNRVQTWIKKKVSGPAVLS